MDFLVKVIAAFAIGVGAVWGLGAYGLFQGQQAIRQAVDLPRTHTKTVDLPKPITPSRMPPIDTSAGRNAALSQVNRQIDLGVRASSRVPQPPRIPGMRY